MEGRLYLEFMFDDMMRIKTWHFSIRQHRELIPRSILAMHVSTAPGVPLGMNDTGLLCSSGCCAGWETSTQSCIAGWSTGGLFPAWINLSLLSLSLLGTGSPDAGSVIQEHHTLWALKLHTQLPPSKCVRRGVCSSAMSCALSCLMPGCPGVWVGCKASFVKGVLQRGCREL